MTRLPATIVWDRKSGNILAAPAPAMKPRTSKIAPTMNTPVIAVAAVDRSDGAPVAVDMRWSAEFSRAACRAPSACITDDRP
jgi:hypothetical protein